MATRQTFSCSIHADGCCSWTYRNLYVTICESQDLEMRVEGTVRFFEPVATSFYLFFLRRLERRGKKKSPRTNIQRAKEALVGPVRLCGRHFPHSPTSAGLFFVDELLSSFCICSSWTFFFFRFKIGERKPVAVTSYVPPDSRTSSTQTDNNHRFFFPPSFFFLNVKMMSHYIETAVVSNVWFQ